MQYFFIPYLAETIIAVEFVVEKQTSVYTCYKKINVSDTFLLCFYL